MGSVRSYGRGYNKTKNTDWQPLLLLGKWPKQVLVTWHKETGVINFRTLAVQSRLIETSLFCRSAIEAKELAKEYFEARQADFNWG